jgi:Putative transposase/Transposase zinc-binding domain
MIEVADILRRHGPAYRQQQPLLPSQQKVLTDLVRCRTAACGGQLYQCDRCGYEHYSYHSCGNRHCPKCHGQQTQRWLEQQRERLLPCAFYFVTVTLPAQLRALVYARQKALYGLLLKCAAASLQKLAWDPNYVGGQLAMLAVLHTWTRELRDHPHVHLLVSAGGLSRDGQSWVPAKNPAFLIPGYAVSKIFKGKFKAGLKKLGAFNQVPPAVWQRPWKNVQIQHAGRGEKVLDYLGRYAFRIAISNSRLERFENGQVTFGYRDRKTQEKRHLTLSAEEFIGRFLRHVLPKGFVKVRSYGLWSGVNGDKLKKARALLAAAQPPAPQAPALRAEAQPPASTQSPPQCPQCQSGHLIWIASLLRQRSAPPPERWPQQTRAP